MAKEETGLIDLEKTALGRTWPTRVRLQGELTSYPGDTAQQGGGPLIARVMVAIPLRLMAESSEKHPAENRQMRSRHPLVYIPTQTEIERG